MLDDDRSFLGEEDRYPRHDELCAKAWPQAWRYLPVTGGPIGADMLWPLSADAFAFPTRAMRWAYAESWAP